MDKKHAAGMCNLRNKKQEGKIKTMRLDKFLKVSRLIKRRTVANEACDAGRVMVNGKPAKASVNVKVGDVIEIAFGTVRFVTSSIKRPVVPVAYISCLLRIPRYAIVKFCINIFFASCAIKPMFIVSPLQVNFIPSLTKTSTD